MKRIEELQLYNFKFFTDTDNLLKVGNKNLLIWGENGSGKSSIYWAIYTILQCSFKDDAGIDAYFTEGGTKNLINVDAPSGSDAFVRMKLDDGNDYKIALGSENVKGVTEVQLSAISSDFIDYNVIASFLRFYHRDDPQLFGMFEEEIFRFLPFAPPAPFTFPYFDNAWEKVFDGLEKDAGTNKYPSPGSTTYDQYKTLVDEFNRQLKTILGLVTVKANQLLLTKFKYQMEIELKYTDFEFKLNRTRTKVEFTQPAIELKVNDYYGKGPVVKKPHSFLNEAKKTAIGLAIRLGILERRLLADKLNILALDDLLISLDMSNREVVLKLLFEEYQDNYQLLIFTHDRQFYSIAKHKIEHGYDKTKWSFWELYIDERTAVSKPRLFENETDLSIANKHLLNNDYPAAANYLRKHCEKVIEKYLPESCYADIEKKESNKNYPLDSVLNKSAAFLTRINQPLSVAKVNQLKQYVNMLLNPLSHTERGVERYKGEIKDVMNLLDELETALIPIKKKKILPEGTELFLNLQKSVTVFYKVRLKLKEDLYIYDNAGVPTLSLCKTDSEHFWELDRTGATVQEGPYKFIQNQELADAYNSITTFHTVNIPVIPDWQKLFSIDNGTALNTLMTF